MEERLGHGEVGTVNLNSTLINLHTLGNLVLTNALISITRAKEKKRRGEEGRGEERRGEERRGEERGKEARVTCLPREQ